MSVATSIPPCIRLSTTSSASSSNTSSSTVLRLSHNSSKPCMSFNTIRSSQTDGPIRRPMAPPTSPTPPLQPPSPPSVSAPPPPPKAAAMVEDKSVITLEFQRAKARELQEYFKQKKLELASQGPVFDGQCSGLLSGCSQSMQLAQTSSIK
ncbi:hypothetical protein KSS87_020285 [Heliosperma pusillum]|nr:hypothetical protein KSS87_020285 [Heliosperma pusillum]